MHGGIDMPELQLVRLPAFHLRNNAETVFLARNHTDLLGLLVENQIKTVRDALRETRTEYREEDDYRNEFFHRETTLDEIFGL